MHIQTLKLFNFRNLHDLKLAFSPGVNFIIGKNGQGKTNLIESIYILSATKSFRTSRSKELINWDANGVSIFAEVAQAAGDIDLGWAIDAGAKRFYLNGKQLKSAAAFVGQVLCVSFSPTDLALIKGSPGHRRRFLDRLIVSRKPALMEDYLAYQRALKNKSKLLRSGVEDRRMLDTWNTILAGSAGKICYERLQALEILESFANEVHREFSPGDGNVSFEIKSSLLKEGEVLSENFIFDEFSKYMDREIKLKSCVVGVHRDDIVFKLNNRDTRAFASQGQSRSLTLSLKLAFISILEKERDDSPIVLLDDVDSELDSGRSGAFFDLILNGQRQVFITGTDMSVSTVDHGSKHSILTVVGGVFSEVE